MSEDEELERLRAQRQAEMEQQAQSQAQQGQVQRAQEEAYRQQVEAQKRAILAKVLTDEARERLDNIKIANPDFANSIENQLIQLAQSGRLRGRITDEQLKNMLRQFQSSRKEQNIRISRK